jgi:hypothetical protein
MALLVLLHRSHGIPVAGRAFYMTEADYSQVVSAFLIAYAVIPGAAMLAGRKEG